MWADLLPCRDPQGSHQLPAGAGRLHDHHCGRLCPLLLHTLQEVRGDAIQQMNAAHRETLRTIFINILKNNLQNIHQEVEGKDEALRFNYVQQH